MKIPFKEIDFCQEVYLVEGEKLISALGSGEFLQVKNLMTLGVGLLNSALL